MTAAEREPLDLRLAAGAAVGWLLLALDLGRAPGIVAAVAAAAAAVGVGALVAARGGVRWAAAVGLAGFCAALILAPFAGRLVHARAGPLVRLAGAHAAVSLSLTTDADPRPLVAKGVGGPSRVTVDTTAQRITWRGRRLTAGGHVLVIAQSAGWSDLLPGQRIRIDGQLQPSLDDPTGASLFAVHRPTLVGRPPWWQRLAGRVRDSLRRASAGLPDGPRGLLPGLVDGDTSGLDPALAARFQIAGLTHLVAVSGTNCSILLGAVLLALRRFGARRGICAVAGAAVLVAFVVVARPSPSVLRAAVMAGIALAALASGRPRQAMPALSAAVIALLIWNPLLAVDHGFAMSVLATAALLLIAPGWADALRRRRVPPVVAEAIAVAAAAHLVTVPVVVAISGRVSLVAIPANVLAEPVVAVGTVLGFCAALVAPWGLGAAQVLAQVAGWPCRWLVRDADFFGGLDGASVPWPSGTLGGLALVGLLALAVVLGRRPVLRRMMAVAVAGAVVVQVPVRELIAMTDWPPTGWIFAACDVGQGDGLILNAGPHVAVEIDAGPDPVLIDRCLSGFGVRDIALLVLTHFHLDHVGGISGAYHDRRIGRVVVSPLADPASGVDIVRRAAAQHSTPVGLAPVGGSFDVGRVHLDVLGPATTFHDTHSDPNNSSVVLRATVAGIRILLPGDAEVDAQQALLDSGADLRADVLKVAHHGSAYFVPQFLAAVHAQVGVISVGLNNDYGHPAPSLLDAMRGLGVPVARTDHDGTVAVADRGGRLSLVALGHSAAGTASGRLSRTGLPVPAASVSDARCQDVDVPARPISVADLPDQLPVLILLVGDEELLVGRAVSAIAARARQADPDVTETELTGAALDGPELHELAGPSLFGEARLLVIRSAQDVRSAAADVLRPYLTAPADGATLVLQHAGGAKGKALLDAARKAGALEVGCAKLTRLDERCDFVRAEVRAAGGTIGSDAVAGLVDAVGSDLRELAAVSAQLVSDCGGKITIDVVREYHTGRAESQRVRGVRPGHARKCRGRARDTAVRTGRRGAARRHRRRHGRRCPHGGTGSRGNPRVWAGRQRIRAGGHPEDAAVEGEAGDVAGPRLERARAAAGPGRRGRAQCRRQGRCRRCSLRPGARDSRPGGCAPPHLTVGRRGRTGYAPRGGSRPGRSRPPTAAAEEAAQTAESPRPHRSMRRGLSRLGG